MIICGIDPGTRTTGYGILDISASNSRYIAHGIISPTDKDLGKRLEAIFKELSKVLDKYSPAEIAVETSFYAINAQSALRLGQVRGVVILAATLMHIPVFEYTPTEVKKATCGYGRAGKAQVATMVRILLGLPKDSLMPEDASDALAVCVCHSSSRLMKGLAI
ncbi:MAG TPA: crossover junction endodeoxyribonuclease RuvC [Deltaproteobacteria bacterium]|nr:crossover junction endodeoxyribonuclease RuvC [Deltaproteobacteria bacterium]